MVSVRDLIDVNKLDAPYVIVPGQVLRMPGGGGEYVVRRGDALLLVARRLGVDFQTLARLNGKNPPYTIYVGEKLQLPGAPTRMASGSAMARAGGAMVIASPNSGTGDHQPSVASTRVVAQAPPPPAPPSSGVVTPSPSGVITPSPSGVITPSPSGVITPSPSGVITPSSSGVVTPAPAKNAAPAPEPRHPAFEPSPTLPPPAPAPLGQGFVWPVKGEVLSPFGPVGKGQNNDGINISAARGTPVRATENGVVVYVGNELKGFGNLLLIKHAGGWVSAYAHNDQLMVRKGDAVSRGQQIATVGSSGGVDTPQLHFELRRGTEAVDPAAHLNGA